MIESKYSGDEFIDYKPLYIFLFNGIADILDSESTYQQVIAELKLLQCKAEDAYIEQGELRDCNDLSGGE